MAKNKKNVDPGMAGTDDLEDQPVAILEEDRTDRPFADDLAAAFDEKSQAAEKHPAPNIIFIGEGDAPAGLYGSLKCEMPDSKTQKAGFYHPRAKEIIAAFPRKYKRFQRLGDL